ncbi:hypothetical protein BUALT_Bualt15G0125500 [Buddleja alternifolia]|uniref:DDE Tnp4 domain-containing protein n=1 Tax=Buddleja alternifolia TaxID=168488 RepID=A0AAV6WD39_9LAMI|nr:hypothetical protein BUALT_Bualt15G0125500 [Buddleja alternifolia]
MTRLCRKKIQIFLIVQEIIEQSLVFINLVIALLQDERFGNRRSRERVVRYVMAHRRPDQVSHMRRIVELSDTSCVDNLRMNRNAFGRLCYLLEHVGGLVDSRHVSLSEKGCLGALDGSYINVRVCDSEKPRYRNRKGDVSINLLGVVDRSCKFVYMLPGWEGSAADARVLRNAINRPHGLRVPNEIIILSSDDEDERDNDIFYPIMNVIQIDDDEEGEGSTTSNLVGEGKMSVNVLLDPTNENSTNVKSPQYNFGPWGPSDITPTKPPTLNFLTPKKEPIEKTSSTTAKIMKKLKFP